ncbi:SEC10/PgrA surface exclusion domain-containing protein [Levilactobacillus bambusae]|uniref:Gram-positive cocci surface proteins LPxTG domain-containing protein n=1 Tax=Levilactobacillus bambusae TaxID=2024736 RepID=A0A2V1MYY6_9LACO|nr:SEC10/PgrA surface exclusion domain-containing protein [Levilactobacillus bambusae]PWG00022.1 hypothetical protein DCM90_03535 [Levilactobacillus bambusae]
MTSRITRKQYQYFLHTSKKNRIKKNLAVTGTAVLGLGIAVTLANPNTAEAATVKNDATKKSQTVQSNDQKLDDDINQAQDDVNHAQDNADQTQNAADNAHDTADNSQDKADDAQNNADNAQDALNDAKNDEQDAQNVADNATDDNINDAQGAVDDQQNQNDQLGQDVEDNQDNVNHAQDNVDDAQNNVNDAQHEADQSDNAVNDAQNNVDQAQNNVDNGSAQADQNLSNAQNDLNNAKNKEQQAQHDADQSDQKVSDAQNNVDNAQKGVNDANQAQNNAQQNADNANKAQNDAQNALDHAYSQPHENQNQIHMSQDYIDALNAYAKASPSDSNYQQILDNLLKATQNEWKQNGGYISDSHDQTVKINSQADLNKYMDELNQYAQQLINGVRDQFGTSDVILSDGSKQVGQDMGDAYTNNNWDIQNGHDNTTNKNVAQSNGLSQLSDQDLDLVINKVIQDGNWGLTLDDFKKAVYNAMINLLFNGEEWDHATSLAGNRLGAKDQDVYFGLGFSEFHPTGDTYQGAPLQKGQTIFNALFNFMYDYTIQDSSKFDSNPIKSNVISQDEIKQLENDLAAKKTAANEANAALAAAKSNTAKANDTLTKAKQALTNAKTAQTKAHTALTNAQNAVKSATAAVEAAQKAANDAHASMADRQQALADAKVALKAAQATQAQKHAALDNAKAKLATAKQALNDAKTQLTQAEQALKDGQQALRDKQAHLDELKNADANLAKAKQAVADAQQAYDDALRDAKAAQNVANGDDATYQILQQLADNAKKALADAQAKLDQLEHQKDINDAIDNAVSGQESATDTDASSNYDDNSSASIISSDNKVNGSNAVYPLAEIPGTKVNGTASVDLSHSQVDKDVTVRQLPQTGEKQGSYLTMMGMVLMSLLALFGLADKKYRKWM